MAGPVRYLSGRQNSVKIGIPDYRTEDTSLVVLGRVGIGTTNATSDLYVKGGGEFTGVVTATKFDGAFENITLTGCLLYTSPSPRDLYRSRMPSSA